MKKSLFAFTILSAFATIASAQTSVVIYGVADAAIATEDRGGPLGSTTRINSGSQSGSRLGFRGTEDLGGGLSAVFVLENGFSVDTGAAAQGGLLFGRQAFVGVAGSFGTIRIGRQKNVLYDTLDAIDPFRIGLAGDAFRLFTTYDQRANNTIAYLTPKFGGFSGQATYSFGEVAGNASASRQIGVTGSYAAGPIYAAVAYHKVENATGTDDANTTLIGGTYDFGVAKAHLGYAINKGVSTLDTRDMLVGVTVPFGPHAILADYIRKTDKFANNTDVNQIAIGYTYAMSKRTNLYTSYSRTDNDSAVKYNADINGGKAKLFNVGVRHVF